MMSKDNDGIYFINPNLSSEQLQAEAEGILMSIMVCIDILQQEYSAQLPEQPQHFLRMLYNCTQQLFLLYCAVFPLKSMNGKVYATRELIFVLNSTLNETKKHDYLRGMVSHLVALCEEGLQTTLLEHLNDRGGNVLMSATLQVQIFRQTVETLQMRQQYYKIDS